MNLGVVVSTIGNGSERLGQVSALSLGADGDTNLSGWVWMISSSACEQGVDLVLTSGDGGESKSDRWEELLASLPQLLDQWQVEPQALSLSRQVTALLQGVLEELEVWWLEKGLSGTDWVGRVSDDDIVLVLVVGEELESISDVYGDSRVVVTFGHVG